MTSRLARTSHSTVARGRLKLLYLAAAVLVLPGLAQQAASPGDPALRAALTELLRGGSPEAAVQRAQTALRQAPDDPGVRQEYVLLHLALARHWLAARQYDGAVTALEAILAVDPQHAQALALRREIDAARAAAGEHADQVVELLRLELFEAALDRIGELAALRPDLAGRLAPQRQAAWIGAADDQYLARNFNEAFALYEHVLGSYPDAPADVQSRWGIALALALAESDFTQPLESDAAGKLLARATDVLRTTNAPVVGQVIDGLLAERAGKWLDAGRTYAAALGTAWELPPADRRQQQIAELRRQAVQRVRELYRVTPTRRREGPWVVVLPDTWKQRQTARFDVSARSDLIAARVAEALEFHYPRLAQWLGSEARVSWEPRLEVRVHATQADLHRATDTGGITHAVSHTRLQGERVILRKLEVFQADPWLLSATLPHELTHAILADARRQASPPLAIAEGLALQAEPAARRLMCRRLLADPPPTAVELLAARRPDSDLERFYAKCDALTTWLLDRRAQRPGATTQAAPIQALLLALLSGPDANWWRPFGWSTAEEAQADWRTWFAARRDPPRMPLMLLVAPAPEHGPQRQAAPPGKAPP